MIIDQIISRIEKNEVFWLCLDTTGNIKEESLEALELKKAQDLVGGYIEPIYLPKFLILVNEDGNRLNLDKNKLAKLILEKLTKRQIVDIVGNIIIVHRKLFS